MTGFNIWQSLRLTLLLLGMAFTTVACRSKIKASVNSKPAGATQSILLLEEIFTLIDSKAAAFGVDPTQAGARRAALTAHLQKLDSRARQNPGSVLSAFLPEALRLYNSPALTLTEGQAAQVEQIGRTIELVYGAALTALSQNSMLDIDVVRNSATVTFKSGIDIAGNASLATINIISQALARAALAPLGETPVSADAGRREDQLKAISQAILNENAGSESVRDVIKALTNQVIATAPEAEVSGLVKKLAEALTTAAISSGASSGDTAQSEKLVASIREGITGAIADAPLSDSDKAKLVATATQASTAAAASSQMSPSPSPSTAPATPASALIFGGLTSVTDITTTKATLNWTDVPDAATYTVLRVNGTSLTYVATVAAPATRGTAVTFQLTGLSPATSYTYRVRALDLQGISESNATNQTFSTDDPGSFAAVSDLGVAEGAASQTSALSCSDGYSSAPLLTLTAQTDTDSNCTVTLPPFPVYLSCAPTHKTGHAGWSSTITVRCDLNDSSYTRTLTVNVSDTNRAPSLGAISDRSVVAGTAMTAIDPADSSDDQDVDLDTLTYTCTFGGGGFGAGTACTSLPGTPSFTAATGQLTWTPSIPAAIASAPTVYTVVITASDGQGTPLTDAKTIAITVNPAAPTNYVIIPSARSGLGYNYAIMQYEASLSASGSLGADSVTTTETDLSTCSYKFHATETANDISCGTRASTKAAESAPGVAPAASVTWAQAFWACRNASDANFMVRLATREEWLRAARWTDTYANMRTVYTNNTGANCAVGGGSANNTGAASACKTDMNVYDFAGNLSEWVDERMVYYKISDPNDDANTADSEGRFSYAPTIGRTLRNGIDNLTRRYHEIAPTASGLGLALGASYDSAAPFGKQHGPEVETWQDPTTTAATIGFRCVAFPKGSMPTVAELALPGEPIYTSAYLPAGQPQNWKIPENLYVKDTKPEALTITVTTSDGDNANVAEGNIALSWDEWSKCTSALTGGCTSSSSGITYEVYRFVEPVKQDIRLATTWALNESDGGGTALTNPYATSAPLDPIAVNGSNSRLYTPIAQGGAITCNAGVCSYTDISGSFSTKGYYSYIVLAKDSSANSMTPRAQRYRSPYFTGDKPAVAAAHFRTELRLRKAAVFLVDEPYQEAQGAGSQIMVHVPLDKSGLDHDFFIYKYEASSASAVTNDAGAANNAESAVGMNTNTWKNDAAVCHDKFLRQAAYGAECGSFTVNSTGTILRSKQGTAPLVSVNQGHFFRACHNTGFVDGSGHTYYLALPTNAEWTKAADWGDVDLDGDVDQHVLSSLVTPTPANIASLENAAADAVTVRCHTDNNPGSAYASNAAETANCRTRYGAADMVGNVWEWTIDRMYNHTGYDNGSDGLWLAHALKTTDGQNTSPSGFDLLRGSVPADKTKGADITSGMNGDYYYQALALRGAIRGGAWSYTSGAGRWDVSVGSAPWSTSTSVGARCSR